MLPKMWRKHEMFRVVFPASSELMPVATVQEDSRIQWLNMNMARDPINTAPGDLWYLIDYVVTGRSAAVRVDSCPPEVWNVGNGVGQGAVLSALLFALLIDGEFFQRCPFCGRLRINVPELWALLFKVCADALRLGSQCGSLANCFCRLVLLASLP